MSNKAALRQYGNRLVNDIQIYLRSLNTHSANNEVLARTRDALHETLHEHFKEEPQSTLQVQLLPEETFINSTLLPIAISDFDRIKELTRQLQNIGVGELIFDAGVTPDSLSEFASAVYASMHSRGSIETRSFKGIQALEMDYAVTGSSERDAHQVVVWLFSGLLDGLDGLKDLVDEGHTPTMVPFMRHMRLLVDLNSERGTVVKHLCFARHTESEATSIHMAACRTFLAIQIGHQNGMDRTELMAMGLASVMDVITRGTEPSRIIPTLAPYATLSDIAPRVMMILREFELAQRGRKAGRKGQLLHAVDALVNTIHGDQPATLSDVYEELGAISGVESVVMEAIQSWLGEHPIGTIATSKKMGEVLLFDYGEDGTTLRCREIFQDGLGDPTEIRDLDRSEPIHFTGRTDFEFELPDAEA
jgi:hypothetical protein